MDHKLNIEDLQESLQTSFICKKHDSSEKYRSKFLINSGQFSAGNIQKVICDILDELPVANPLISALLLSRTAE